MKALIALAGLTACQATQPTPSIPWLHGLANPIASDHTSDEVARRIDTWSPYSDVDPECSTGAHPGIAIEADLAAPPGNETIMVSLAHGLVIVDRTGKLVTEAPGYYCEGSADELEAIAAGDAYGAKTLAIAATTGGHNERSTWVSLFRVDGRRLDPVFTGTVEERRGAQTLQGAIVLLPGALLYRHPRGRASLWLYNADARAYVLPGEEIDRDHDGPSQTISRR